MAKETSYDLLMVIHQEIKDLRSELWAKATSNEARIIELEKFQYNLMGKIGVGVVVVGGFVTFLMNVCYGWIKDTL
jgi:hypothetical protein